MAAAIPAARSIAGAAIGTTNAFDTTLLLLMDVTASQANDHSNNRYYDYVFHRTAPPFFYFLPLSAYAAARFLFVFRIRQTTIAANAATAMRPPRKPAPRAPVVISVPTWKTR